MLRMKREHQSIRLGDAAQSAIDVDVIDGHDDEYDPPCWGVLRAHYTNGALRTPENERDRALLVDALIELSNSYDAQLHERNTDAESRAFARRACAQLSTAIDRVSKSR